MNLQTITDTYASGSLLEQHVAMRNGPALSHSNRHNAAAAD